MKTRIRAQRIHGKKAGARRVLWKQGESEDRVPGASEKQERHFDRITVATTVGWCLCESTAQK